MVIGKGTEQGFLSEDEIRGYTHEALSRINLAGKRILLIIPDLTRQAPIPLFFKIINDIIGKQARCLHCLIALGTHQPLDEIQFCRRIGISQTDWKQSYNHIQYFNHAYDNPEELICIGSFPEEEIYRISNGLMREIVDVKINKRIMDYDVIILLSPVVPHETAGFSGGTKYFFPGIAGKYEISFFHWLGAIITNPVINGSKDNPVRTFMNKAASFLNIPRITFNMVMHNDGLCGLFIDNGEEGWSKAADLSAKVHIKYLDRPYQKVLGIAPDFYTDVWVAGKVMYKLESIVAEGGELIIYGPQVTEFSFTFKPIIERIGYHVRDYFLKQMDRFSDVPRGVLAHSSNVRGIGTYGNGVEKSRIQVTLATSISQESCQKVNLAYRDYKSLRIDDWKNREDEGILLVENAGGTLYRLN